MAKGWKKMSSKDKRLAAASWTIAAAFVLAGIIALMSGCGRYVPTKLNTLSVKPESRTHNIYIWTHGLNNRMHKAVEYAGKIIREKVFTESNCPGVVVAPATRGQRPGINIYDDIKGTNSFFNNCIEPYSTLTKDGRFGVFNFCENRITDAVWSHALDPDIYLALHGIGKILGLRDTRSLGRVASYTANDRRVRAEKSVSLMFRFRETEKRALRERYCR